MTDEERKEALKLAYKMRCKAFNVVNSSAKNLSKYIEELDQAINEYDNYILDHLEG